METENAKMDEEIGVRKQRMLGVYNKYDKFFFRHSSQISLELRGRVFRRISRLLIYIVVPPDLKDAFWGGGE